MFTLSRSLNISRNELSRYFTSCLNSTFRLWLAEVRFEAAKKMMLDYPDATVTAWDISDDALRIARANATRLGAQVCFERQDALAPPADTALWDVIVSNPPYICMSERAEMSPHVLDHEPATALFVPDSDPLLFYRAIARYATRALKPGGTLLFEINALYASETSAMLHALGFAASVERDQYDRPRFIIARL